MKLCAYCRKKIENNSVVKKKLIYYHIRCFDKMYNQRKIGDEREPGNHNGSIEEK